VFDPGEMNLEKDDGAADLAKRVENEQGNM
jgi:hypothetical protein